MADESGARHNQYMEDGNNDLVNENAENLIEEDYSEEDEYALGAEDEDGLESEEEEEEEEEEITNEDTENEEETASSSGGEEDAYEEGLNGYDVDGLYCPICLDTWANGGDHQVCCLPCGHIYGLSCIKAWIQRHESSRKCPQCKKSCSLQDIRVLYASRIVAVDYKLQKKVKFLEAKCASMKKKKEEEYIHQGMETMKRYLLEVTSKMDRLEVQTTRLTSKLDRLEEQMEQFFRQQFTNLSVHHGGPLHSYSPAPTIPDADNE